MTAEKSFGQEAGILSEKEGKLEKIVDEIKELSTLEAIGVLDRYANTRALQIAEKAWKDVIMDMTTEEARGASRILSRIKAETGGIK